MDSGNKWVKREILSLAFPALSGTFGIPVGLALNPKIPKKPSSPSRSNALTADPDKTKIGSKLIRKWLIMKEAQCLTRCKMHRLCFPTGDMNVRGKFVYCQIKLGAMQRLRHLTAGALGTSGGATGKHWNLTNKMTI